MDDLIFHLGVKEEKNVHVDDFIIVVQTEFQRHLMPIKEYAVTLHFITFFINLGYFSN